MTANAAAHRASQTEIVYVVDDDEAVRDSLRWLLEGQGFRVTAYDSAERFLAALPPGASGTAPGCLIADVRMPGMSGTELHDELI
ncbi:MAG: response regulator transcription factor, partial [Burkholderiaceae bacterium]